MHIFVFISLHILEKKQVIVVKKYSEDKSLQSFVLSHNPPFFTPSLTSFSIFTFCILVVHIKFPSVTPKYEKSAHNFQQGKIKLFFKVNIFFYSFVFAKIKIFLLFILFLFFLLLYTKVSTYTH